MTREQREAAMTRAELQAVVEVILGIHAQPDRVDTIMRAADAYAMACTALAARWRELPEAAP